MPKPDALAKPANTSLATADSFDAADEALVERAIGHIRTVLARTVERGLDEVGQYLLKTFYRNDAEAYLSHGPTKNASLSLLVRRCDSIAFPVSRSFLGNALRVAALSQGLPNDAPYLHLPASHRIALARVDDPSRRDRLAARAADGELSVDKVRALVKKDVAREREKHPVAPRGVPPIVKALEALVEIVRDEETGRIPFKRSDVNDLSQGYRERADAAYARLLPRLEELRKLMT